MGQRFKPLMLWQKNMFQIHRESVENKCLKTALLSKGCRKCIILYRCLFLCRLSYFVSINLSLTFISVRSRFLGISPLAFSSGRLLNM